MDNVYDPSQPFVVEKEAVEETVSSLGHDLEINVIDIVTHNSPPASPDPSDALVEQEMWTSHVERQIAQRSIANRGSFDHQDIHDMGPFRNAEASQSGPSCLSADHPTTEATSENETKAIWLLRYKRNPDVFRRRLEEHISLNACRCALEAAGHQWNLPTRAKIFVSPVQYRHTIEALDRGGWPVSSLRM